MPQPRTLDVGMEVHQEAMAVASGAREDGAEVVSLGRSGTRQGDRDRLMRKRHSQSQPLVFVSAAGPCGSWRSRELTKQGSVCWVVAPSLLPQPAGDRVKTDRRAAVQLARLRRSGALTPGAVPPVADDARRDLRRARDDARRELHTAQCRLNALRLRQDLRETGQATWRPAHLRWLSAVVGPTPAQPIVCQAYVRAGTEHPARLQRLDQARHEPVNTGRLAPVVEALQALRGVQGTVAVTIVAERGDLPRVAPPRQLMRDLGLTPSAYSRGERRRQGGITNAGHPPARRALVEGAWADRDPATVSRHRQLRREHRPKGRQDLSWTAQVRLGQRYRHLRARGNHAHQVVVALARARAAFLGALAQQVRLRPSIPTTSGFVERPNSCAGPRQRRRPGVGSSATA